MTILLVDDDPDDIDFFCDAIKEVDSKIFIMTAPDGQDCIKRLEEIKPDIIFLDINMPLMNGKDCLGEIRKNAAYASIDVIMYSTSILPRDIDNFKKLNASYVTKPANFKGLIEMLTNIIKVGS